MFSRLKKYFFTGLAVFLPLVLTVYIFIWVLNFAEGLLGHTLKPLFLEYYDFYFWGLGILILLAVILFCGFLATNYFGRAAHSFAEKIVLRVPLMASIYPAFKEIANFMFREKATFQQVVLAEWPSKDTYVVGFLTNTTAARISEKAGRKLLNVMVPHVPNPLTGFLVVLPEDRVQYLDITVEEALRIIVSGGVVNADPITKSDDPKASS
ncbi:MAG: DUF502 domain-containing protein [Candidatus Omnitrophica bacterium]|nr:DUF502 domain-containing protein [Candidatus Omnitrophota bacterium]